MGVIIYNHENNIFLARSHKWKDQWVVPGGKLDLGESLEEGVKREVKEETHLDIENIQLISVDESIFPEDYNSKKHMIFLNYSAKAKSNEVKLNEELQEYVWINPRKSFTLNLNSSTRKFIEKFIEIFRF
ncbi:MAG: NUDIX domain-containing protein [Nanoarchaeota archaeon]|nr:NUDIX domain-containing protein [Nanoarchaeota archaeon]